MCVCVCVCVCVVWWDTSCCFHGSQDTESWSQIYPWNSLEIGFLSAVVGPLTSSIFAPSSGTPVSQGGPESPNCDHRAVQSWRPSPPCEFVSPSFQGGPRGTVVGARGCVPGCVRQGAAGGSRGRPGAGRREGGEPPRAETLNRLHFPQILPFPLLPQAGGEAASTALRAPSPGLALSPGTASSPPPKV